MLKKLYDRCVELARHKFSKPLLGFVAFIESFFFPVPPDLMIIPMDNWQGQPWGEIGLDWTPISPGISTVGDLERFTITSMLGADEILENGVSTDRPYEILVHPKITSGSDIVFALDELDLAGVKFLPAVSVPNTGPFAGQICNGISIVVTDINVLEPWMVAIGIAEKIKTIYPDIEFTTTREH